MSNKDIKAFIRNIEILIPVNDANSKRFIRDIQSSITEYAYNHKGCSVDDIIQEFGSSRDIAQDHIESLDIDNLIRKLTTVKYLRRLIAIVAVTAVAALSIYTAYLHHGYNEFKESMMNYENSVIEEIGE